MSASSRRTCDDMSLKRFSKGFYFGIKDREIEVSLGTSKNDRPTCRSLIHYAANVEIFSLEPCQTEFVFSGHYMRWPGTANGRKKKSLWAIYECMCGEKFAIFLTDRCSKFQTQKYWVLINGCFMNTHEGLQSKILLSLCLVIKRKVFLLQVYMAYLDFR